jgi:hypothetical protein
MKSGGLEIGHDAEVRGERKPLAKRLERIDATDAHALRFPRFCGLGCDKGEDSHEQE